MTLSMVTEQALVTGPEAADPLIVRLQRAEPSAVAEVYDAHNGAVRAFAKRLLGDATTAEDLVHEVFVCLPQAARNFRDGAALRTFLISIAVNHARHHVRAAQRRRKALSAYGSLDRESPRDPEHEARRKELAALLTRALDRLPVEQRVAFVLCEVEERTSVEAAEIVGAPEATLRTRLFHAKRKLREALAVEAEP